MSAVTTFFFSRIQGNKVYSPTGEVLGKIKDIIVEQTTERPRVIALQVATKDGVKAIDYNCISVDKIKGQYRFTASDLAEITPDSEKVLYLAKNVLDRQIVDMNGRKLVRVNDMRLASLASGTYLISADVGVEGLLRRLGVAKLFKGVLRPFGASLPSHHILWDDIQAVDFGHEGIKLSKDYSNLHRLHPSDLADIIEDMDTNTRLAVFSSLNDEQAADVLEELEPEAYTALLEGMSVEKAADLLEIMPADEAADILETLNEDVAESLLKEMESEASAEVRELMEYPDDSVGSIMTTDYIFFDKDETVAATIDDLRRQKPESDVIYYLYITDRNEHLVANVSLRDLIVSDPGTRLSDIMNEEVVFVYDTDSIESLGEIITKYNLLAVPVVDEDHTLMGMVIINDVIHNLLRLKRKRA